MDAYAAQLDVQIGNGLKTLTHYSAFTVFQLHSNTPTSFIRVLAGPMGMHANKDPYPAHRLFLPPRCDTPVAKNKAVTQAQCHPTHTLIDFILTNLTPHYPTKEQIHRQ